MWRGGSTLVVGDRNLPIFIEKIHSMAPVQPKEKRSKHKKAKNAALDLKHNTEYRRMIYYEVNIERAGLQRSITVGAGLGMKAIVCSLLCFFCIFFILFICFFSWCFKTGVLFFV